MPIDTEFKSQTYTWFLLEENTEPVVSAGADILPAATNADGGCGGGNRRQ